MDNYTINILSIDKCFDRYLSYNDPYIKYFTLIIDGPITLIAVILTIVSSYFALRFLNRADLNRSLTAALRSLCICDLALMIIVLLFYCIEANASLIFDENHLWPLNTIIWLPYQCSCIAMTASTWLVLLIAWRRCVVVLWPFKYASHSYANATLLSNTTTNSNPSLVLLTTGNTPPHHHIRQSMIAQPSSTIRLFYLPIIIVIISFVVNIPLYFELDTVECWHPQLQAFSTQVVVSSLRHQDWYRNWFRLFINMTTQSLCPMIVILLLTAATESRLYATMRHRSRLFESQRRCRSQVLAERIREQCSRTVAIFIVVKFLLLRSPAVIIEMIERFDQLDNWSGVPYLVKISNLFVVVNSATNSLAYFGKKRWLEKRLHRRLMRNDGRPINEL